MIGREGFSRHGGTAEVVHERLEVALCVSCPSTFSISMIQGAVRDGSLLRFLAQR